MKLFDKIKTIFNNKQPEQTVVPEVVEKVVTPIKPRKPRKPRKPKEIKQEEKVVEVKSAELSAKDIATLSGQPYVSILKMDINPSNITEGSFELDWNDLFIAKLIKAGYKIKKNDTDADIVDRWFTDVARSIVLEMHEQMNADPDIRDLRVIHKKDIGNNRTEVS
jgi:hypothetical protein